MGWYTPWQGSPTNLKWQLPDDKPVFVSEFGGESKYQSNFGPKDAAGYWSEEFQADIYRKQIEMFRATRRSFAEGTSTINLIGVCPWILFDYLSLCRMHPVYQNGFNRKGIVVYGYFFIPNYPSDIATVNFDRSGTTKIGKYLLNHSFMIYLSIGALVGVHFFIGKHIGSVYSDRIAAGQGLAQKNTVLSILNYYAFLLQNPHLFVA